jgi:hypothetical protein
VRQARLWSAVGGGRLAVGGGAPPLARAARRVCGVPALRRAPATAGRRMRPPHAARSTRTQLHPSLARAPAPRPRPRPAPRMPPHSRSLSRLRAVDFYKKIPSDLTEATLTGAWLSIVASVIMSTLLVLVSRMAGAGGPGRRRSRRRRRPSPAAEPRCARRRGASRARRKAARERRHAGPAPRPTACLQRPAAPRLPTPPPPPRPCRRRRARRRSCRRSCASRRPARWWWTAPPATSCSRSRSTSGARLPGDGPEAPRGCAFWGVAGETVLGRPARGRHAWAAGRWAGACEGTAAGRLRGRRGAHAAQMLARSASPGVGMPKRPLALPPRRRPRRLLLSPSQTTLPKTPRVRAPRSFPALSCEFATLDISDSLGTVRAPTGRPRFGRSRGGGAAPLPRCRAGREQGPFRPLRSQSQAGPWRAARCARRSEGCVACCVSLQTSTGRPLPPALDFLCRSA